MGLNKLSRTQLIKKIELLNNQLAEFSRNRIIDTPAKNSSGENEELYRVLYNSSKDAIMTIAPPSWKFTSGNKAILEMYKVNTIEEFTTLGPWDVSPEVQPDGRKSAEKAKEMIEAAMESGSNFFEWTHQRVTGEDFPATVLLSRVKLSNTVLLQATVRDISNEKRVFSELQISEKKFGELFDNMNESFSLAKIITDENNNPVDYIFLEVNPVFAKRAGLKPEEFINKRILELFPNIEKYWIEHFGQVALSGKPAQFTNYSADLKKYFEVNAYSPQHGYVAAIMTDVTERMLAEKALNHERDFTETALNSQKDTFFLFNPATGKALRWNKSFKEITGYTDKEIAGLRAPDSYYSEDDLKKLPIFINELLKTGHGVIDLDLICKDGRRVPTEYSVSVIKDDLENPKYFISIGRDISEFKKAVEEKERLEKRLLRAQKLETIGTLAGGVAHDFNNILAPIMGYTEIAMSSLKKTDHNYRYLQNVLKAALRAKDLIQQILLFSRQSEKEHQAVSVQSIINEVLKLLRPSIPTTIEIKKRIDNSCENVRADASQIHQVIVNLCTNAWQAMEKKGGTLKIDLKQLQVDSITAKLHPNLNEAEYACLTVTDTGNGMDSKTQEHIFEPFFTTKEVDRGTGLGLSVVHGIIQSHNGDIFVYSEPGKGSAFHVYLPIIKGSETIEKETRNNDARGTEYLMIVDDEQGISEMLKLMLERFGYKTDIFKTGSDALKEFKSHPDKYDMIISDLTMPKMTGLELADQLHKIRPKFPVIIITGFSDNLTFKKQQQYGIGHVLSKPIVMSDLTAIVRSVLDKN